MAGVTAGALSGLKLGGGKKGAKDLAVKILAWASFVVGGVAASPLLAATFIGGVIDNIFSVLPDWAPPVGLFLLVVGIAIDLIVDGVPNRVALYGAMAICSVARSVDGRLGTNVEKWANEARTAIQGDLQEWLGTASVVAMALALAGAGWLVARRTMRSKASPAMG